MKSNFILHAISNYMLSNCQDNQNPSGISNVSGIPDTVLPIYHRQVLLSPASGKTTRSLYAPYLQLQNIAYHSPSCHNQ